MKLTVNATATGRATIGPKGRVTIPAHIREEMKVAAGDEVVFQVSDGRTELVPLAVVPRDQVWFYSTEMRERVAQAEIEIVTGKTKRVSTVEAAQAHLDSLKRGKK